MPRNGLDSVINRNVIVLPADSTAEQAGKAMLTNGVGSVFISDRHGHIVGVVTDRDLACRVVAGSVSASVPLSEVMTRGPSRMDETSNLDEAIRIMEESGIRRVPLVRRKLDGTERCVGVVSLDDLIVSDKVGHEELMRIVKSQVMRRIGASESYRRRPSGLSHSVSLATGLGAELAGELLFLVLRTIVGRLHGTAAMRLMMTLPPDLKNRLLGEPTGPDPSLTAHRMISELMIEHDFPKELAVSFSIKTCHALEEWVGVEAFAHVKAQLPKDLRELFVSGEGLAESRMAS